MDTLTGLAYLGFSLWLVFNGALIMSRKRGRIPLSLRARNSKELRPIVYLGVPAQIFGATQALAGSVALGSAWGVGGFTIYGCISGILVLFVGNLIALARYLAEVKA